MSKFQTNFSNYMSIVAEDKGLKFTLGGDAIIIYGGQDVAIELTCFGPDIYLYYFDHFTTNAIAYCSQISLLDPHSIEYIMKWVDKVDASRVTQSNHRSLSRSWI